MTTGNIGTAVPARTRSTLKRAFGPTRFKICALVGLLLFGLCVVQCSDDSARSTAAASGLAVTLARPPVATAGTGDLERLARSDHIGLLQRCLDNYRDKYADYTCTFTKQERIGGVLGKEQEIRVRFRESPFSAAMTWVTNPPQGDRVLYVEGRNNNQMQVRPASAFLRALIPGGVSRKPDGAEALKGTLHGVNRFGFECGMKSLLKVYRQAKRNGDLQEEFGGYCTLDGRDTLLLVRHLNTERKDYPARKTTIYIDIQHLVPVMVESYDWGAGDLLCRYTYADVQFNVGLTEADFTPESIGLKRD